MENTNIQNEIQSKKAYEQPSIEVIELDATPLLFVGSPNDTTTPYNDNNYFD